MIPRHDLGTRTSLICSWILGMTVLGVVTAGVTPPAYAQREDSGAKPRDSRPPRKMDHRASSGKKTGEGLKGEKVKLPLAERPDVPIVRAKPQNAAR